MARRALVVDLGRIGDGYAAVPCTERYPAARGVAGQRIGYRRSVDVARGRGDPDQVAVGGAFRNRVGGIVAVDRLGRRHVGDGNAEGLGGELAAGVGRLDGDVVAGGEIGRAHV